MKHFDFKKLLLFLILLFLPTQLGKHFWPPFSFLLGIRSDYLSPTLFFTDVFIVFLILLFLLFPSKMVKKQLAQKIKKYYIEIGIGIITLLSGIAFSKEPLLGLYGFIKLLEFIFLGISIVWLPKKTVWHIAGYAFAIGMLFEGILAFAQFSSQASIGGLLYFFGERTFTAATPGIANASINGHLILRPYGTLSHPNVLSGYMLLGLLIVYGSFFFVKKKLIQILFAVSIAVGAIIVFLSLSRVAILILFILTGMFLLSVFRKHYPTLILFVGLFVLICLAGFAPFLYGRFTSLNLYDESLVDRIEGVKNASLLFIKYPFFGVGLSNYLPNVILQQTTSTSLYAFLQPVHNLYLLLLTEVGTVGFTIIAFWVGRLLQKLFFSPVPQRNILLIMLFVVFMLGLFDHFFWTLQQGRMLLVIVFALAVRSLRSV